MYTQFNVQYHRIPSNINNLSIKTGKLDPVLQKMPEPGASFLTALIKYICYHAIKATAF